MPLKKNGGFCYQKLMSSSHYKKYNIGLDFPDLFLQKSVASVFVILVYLRYNTFV